MTRFARARGSKASNERVPEESTSWYMMKEQMKRSTFNQETDRYDIKKRDFPVSDSNVSRNQHKLPDSNCKVWEEFDVHSKESAQMKYANPNIETNKLLCADIKPAKKSKCNILNIENASIANKKLIKKKYVKTSGNTFLVNPDEFVLESIAAKEEKHNDNISERKLKKKKKHTEPKLSGITSRNNTENMSNFLKEKISASYEISNKKGIDKKHAEDGFSIYKPERNGNQLPNSLEDTCNKNSKAFDENRVQKGNKIKKNHKEVESDWACQINSNYESNTSGETYCEGGEMFSENIILKKRKKATPFELPSTIEENGKCVSNPVDKNSVTNRRGYIDVATAENSEARVNIPKEKEYGGKRHSSFQKDFRLDTDAKYKKSKYNNFNQPFSKYNNAGNERPTTMYIGGKMVDISYFQGFPVKKEDAHRLYNLRKELQSKGLPRNKVNAAVQAERRRAEKALAREKKVVCFKCRKYGHSMSECPDAEDPSGICFKCGSTEHSVRECRVVQSDSFKYAHCFICQEQGHISRQCPDNPRGLYPKGGACKICGDVTHLRKDCPQLVDDKERSALTVGTVQNNSIEGLDEDLPKELKSNTIRKAVVKF